MLYLTCTTITSVDLAHYGVSRVKDWVSGDCGTILFYPSTWYICDFYLFHIEIEGKGGWIIGGAKGYVGPPLKLLGGGPGPPCPPPSSYAYAYNVMSYGDL